VPLFPGGTGGKICGGKGGEYPGGKSHSFLDPFFNRFRGDISARGGFWPTGEDFRGAPLFFGNFGGTFFLRGAARHEFNKKGRGAAQIFRAGRPLLVF